MIGWSWVITTRAGSAVRLHDVAGIDQSKTHAAVDRRSDMAVGNVQLRVLDLSLIVPYSALILRDDLLLIVQLLFGNRIPGEGLLIALQIDARFVQNRLIVRQLSLDLCQCRLIGPRINLQKGIALMNDLPLLIVHAVDLPHHAAGYGHGINRRHGAERIDVNADIALLRRGGGHGKSRAKWSGYGLICLCGHCSFVSKEKECPGS